MNDEVIKVAEPHAEVQPGQAPLEGESLPEFLKRKEAEETKAAAEAEANTQAVPA